ncbi:hypothetical protein [Phenylobacterium sp.]|uniref:hypothetical protein n=1 Tax=Phenylobacterium sp. TaxID=1871053 RepID=UPI0011F73FC8|nr:hypothetical protein [Phenylobacterium sp.]THD59740.1 MAG: hypothetical protein E8A49_15620 [Phenylobacterium sp.]
MTGKTWLRIVDASGLDGKTLRALVRAELAETYVLRLRNAAPSGEALAFWRDVGEAVGVSADVAEDSVTGELKPAPGA